MASITTRAGKGSPLTNNEVDANFTNLNDDKQEILAEGAFVDGDKSKLDGIESSADVTDTANVTAAGALMDSEVANLAQVKSFDSADYATAAQGSLADTALQDGDTVSSLAITSADINGGTIDGVTIGGASAGAGTFTTLQADTSLNVDGTVTADGLTMDTAADTAYTIELGANRTSASQALGIIRGSWDSTVVAQINLAAGDDTTNKDNGRIFLRTASAGFTANRLQVAESGDISFYEDTGTTPKLFWDARTPVGICWWEQLLALIQTELALQVQSS